MLLANSILDALSGIGMWGFLCVMFICFAAVEITKRALRHKERMAMIQEGINPDAAKTAGDEG